jgi:hypothetical protein
MAENKDVTPSEVHVIQDDRGNTTVDFETDGEAAGTTVTFTDK